MLDLINKVKNEEEVCYRAEVSEFEAIYAALENEEYLNVRDLSLEQIDKGCLDPRYVIYAEFGYWYSSTSFDVNSQILAELIQIHQFFLERIEEGKIRHKVYLAIIEWLHASMFAHAKFIKSNPDIYFEEDKLALDSAFEEYISFIKTNLIDINITQIYQLRDVYKTFQVMQEAEEVNEVGTEQSDEINDTKEECEDSFLASSSLYISDEWSKLLRNIKIYQKLVNEKSWLKAAVVYQVINTALKEFDPTKYFPETFYPYLRDTANAYDHLMHQLSLSNHPLWLMLSQMFNSDPESFSTDESLGGIRDILVRQINDNPQDDSQHYETTMNNDEQDQPNW